ncbi:hypothetical protein AVEN_147020-1, partial [Araneus ventricosus]
LQHSALRPGEASGLPLHEKTLPQHLKNLGYQTHMVGKIIAPKYRTRNVFTGNNASLRFIIFRARVFPVFVLSLCVSFLNEKAKLRGAVFAESEAADVFLS